MRRWDKKMQLSGGIGCPLLVASSYSGVQIQFSIRAVQALTLLSLLSVSEKQTYKQIGDNGVLRSMVQISDKVREIEKP